MISLKCVKNFLRRIKNIFIFYNFTLPYVVPHMKFADTTVNNIMKNAVSEPCTSSDFYYIIIKTKDNRVFELWNANFPYAWVHKVYEIRSKDNKPIDVYEGMEIYSYERNEIYENMRPSRNTMIRFKEWVEDNSERFEPRR